MDDERLEQGEEERPHKRIRLPRQLAAFLGILLLECVMAVGLLLLWAYMAFHLRFSTEVIRAGIVLLYVLPCLCGGLAARRARWKRVPLWSAGLGASFYAILWVIGFFTVSAGGAAGMEILILCAASAALGALLGRKGASDKKSASNE